MTSVMNLVGYSCALEGDLSCPALFEFEVGARQEQGQPFARANHER